MGVSVILFERDIAVVIGEVGVFAVKPEQFGISPFQVHDFKLTQPPFPISPEIPFGRLPARSKGDRFL